MTEKPPIDLVCMGEPMLEFNQQPTPVLGRRLYLEGFGGDTSNAAIAAARQGVRVAYATAIGQDTAGDRLLALWSSEGIETDLVRRSATHQTAVYFVSHGEEGHSFLYYRDNSAASRYAPTDVPDCAIADARAFFASGISQAISTSAADAVFRAIEVARANHTLVAYDTNYRPRLWPARRAASVIHAAVAQADIVFPGMEDAAALTGLREPDAVADFYLRLGPRTVVLKMGADGALLATPDRRMRVPPHDASPFVDATGAGDTFCGAFLARTILGDDAEDAVRYACAAAALKCRSYGAVASIPHAREVAGALNRPEAAS